MLPDPKIRALDDLYLASRPSTGALSTLDSGGLVGFTLYQHCAPEERLERLAGLYMDWGHRDGRALELARRFMARMRSDGWERDRFPEPEPRPLRNVYFTVTRDCNLACPYCYQGLRDRERTEMSLDQALSCLDKIVAGNPSSVVTVTGGEPFGHSEIFSILDGVERRDLRFTVLTNGTLLNADAASRLGGFRGLENLQISLDGISEEIHSLTRGRSFEAVMRGIERAVEHRLPFSLAPTIHSGNLHEIYAIARFAVRHGGAFTPNNLRVFPHFAKHRFTLSQQQLLEVIRSVNSRLIEELGRETVERSQSRLSCLGADEPGAPRPTLECGAGLEVIDINWDGKVYPCNLFRDEAFVLGDIFEEELGTIFARARARGLRTGANRKPKCRECEFVASCGGGCAAAAYYSFGSLLREDDLCAVLYQSRLDRLSPKAPG